MPAQAPGLELDGAAVVRQCLTPRSALPEVVEESHQLDVEDHSVDSGWSGVNIA